MRRIVYVYVLPAIGLLIAVQVLSVFKPEIANYAGFAAVMGMVVWMWIAHFSSRE